MRTIKKRKYSSRKHVCSICGNPMIQIGKPQYMRVNSLYRCNECQRNENLTPYNQDKEIPRDIYGRVLPLLNEEY